MVGRKSRQPDIKISLFKGAFLNDIGNMRMAAGKKFLSGQQPLLMTEIEIKRLPDLAAGAKSKPRPRGIKRFKMNI